VWWLEEALAHDPGTPCPELSGAVHADGCVDGGGYAGLWAAIEVREQAPDATVVLVEATGCGFGASGRNGGFVTPWFDELDALVERFGPDEGVRLAWRSHWAIERVRDFADEHGFDCRFRQEGSLKVATAPRQLARCEPALRACREHGCAELLAEVDPATLPRRTGSPVVVGAVNQVDAASVQPALLVRGLREAALRLGVAIHEGSPVLSLQPGRPARVVTARGSVTADRIVLATNVWAARIRELRRTVAIVASHVVATAPADDRLAATHFADGALVADLRSTLRYMQATPDGRVVFGRAGGALGVAGRVPETMFDDARFVATVERDLRRFFPQLAEVPIEYAWGGAVDRAPGHLPFVGALRDHDNVLYGLGFSGNGVGPSALVGRILGRRALGIADADTTSPLADGPRGYLPPEPLRSLGGAAVRWGATRADDAEEADEAPGPLARALRSLVSASVPPLAEPRLRARSRPPRDV
jgi:glycine/D-amino acid oxidase-like deaminating enzyme